jgi:thiol-disulfide isomerase/thioredoxin
MKKLMSLFLAMILALSICSAALADDPNEAPGTVTMMYSGIVFAPPASFQNAAGVISTDGDMELDKGVNYAYWVYYAMTEDELVAAMNTGDEAMYQKGALLFEVLSIRNDIDFKELNAAFNNYFAEDKLRELGKAGDYTFYLYMTEPSEDYLNLIDDKYKEEYTALAKDADTIAAAITISAPEERPDPYAALIGAKFEFTAKDLEGKEISSADLFAKNEVTMLNIWATWCGPCIGELEELQKLHTDLQEKGCGLVGMLIDDDQETANQLISENGLTYPMVWAPDTLGDFITLEGVPTTLFIGKDGTVLASPIVGADVEGYNETLATLINK